MNLIVRAACWLLVGSMHVERALISLAYRTGLVSDAPSTDLSRLDRMDGVR